MKTTSNMRRIDYLELCQFVIRKQDFCQRWMDRYYRMIRLYKGEKKLINQQIDELSDKYSCLLSPVNYAYKDQLKMGLLMGKLTRAYEKINYCQRKYDALMRYGQYFSNLPFRVLRKQTIPECFWYVPEPGAAITPLEMDHKIIEVDGRSVLVFRDLNNGNHVVHIRTWMTPEAMCEVIIQLDEGVSPTERIATYDEAGARQFIESADASLAQHQQQPMDEDEILAMMERTFFGTAGQ